MASSQRPDFPPVPFSTTFPRHTFRLLELPPELVEIIEKQRTSQSAAPYIHGHRDHSADRLWLKSPPGSFVHLCSRDKSWAVKQVSTSNSIYITQTARGHAPCLDGDKDEDGDAAMDMAPAEDARGGVTAIAQVTNILELIEERPDEEDIDRQIRAMVPLCRDPDNELDSEADGFDPAPRRPPGATDPTPSAAMSDVLAHIAAPTAVVQRLMTKLFVFTSSSEGPGRQNISIPSAALLLRSWRAFAQQCLIDGLKVDCAGGAVDGEKLGSVLTGLREEGQTVVAVTMAILRRLARVKVQAQAHDDSLPVASDLDLNLDLSLDLSLDLTAIAAPGTQWAFDADLARHLVGTWLLETLRLEMSSSSASAPKTIPLDDFTTQWADMLPSSWTTGGLDATSLISSTPGLTISQAHDGDDNDTHAGRVVRLTATGSSSGSATRGGSSSNGNGSGISASATATKPNPSAAEAKSQKKRKWHEKFGAQRSAASATKP